MTKLKNGIYTEPQNLTPAQQKKHDRRKMRVAQKVRAAYERIAKK